MPTIVAMDMNIYINLSKVADTSSPNGLAFTGLFCPTSFLLRLASCLYRFLLLQQATAGDRRRRTSSAQC